LSLQKLTPIRGRKQV